MVNETKETIQSILPKQLEEYQGLFIKLGTNMQSEERSVRWSMIQNKDKVDKFPNGCLEKNWEAGGYNTFDIKDWLDFGGSYGIPLGDTNLLVINSDSAKLESIIEQDSILSDTFTIISCLGRKHYYYYCSDWDLAKIFLNDPNRSLKGRSILINPRKYFGKIYGRSIDNEVIGFVVGPGSEYTVSDSNGKVINKGSYIVSLEKPIKSIKKQDIVNVLDKYMYETKTTPLKRSVEPFRSNNIVKNNLLSIKDVVKHYGIVMEGYDQEWTFPNPLHYNIDLIVRFDTDRWHCNECAIDGDILSFIAICDEDIKVKNCKEAKELNSKMVYKQAKDIEEHLLVSKLELSKADPSQLIIKEHSNCYYQRRKEMDTSDGMFTTTGIYLDEAELKKQKRKKDGELSKAFKPSILITKYGENITSWITYEKANRLYNWELDLEGVDCTLPRITQIGMVDLINGKKINAYEAYKIAFEIITDYISFPVEQTQADLIALWVLQTYVYMIFRAGPNLFFLADKSSGKTVLMELLADITFMGTFITDINEAPLYRSLESHQHTAFFDEAEYLSGRKNFLKNDKYYAVLKLLKSANMKSGKTLRCDTDNNNLTKEYRTYSLKGAGSTIGPEENLGDRFITIRMAEDKKKKEMIWDIDDDENCKRKAQLAKDTFYQFAHCNYTDIRDLQRGKHVYKKYNINNREKDLFGGLFIIAELVRKTNKTEGDKLIEKLVKLYNAHITKKETTNALNNPTVRLAATILRLLNEKKSNSLELIIPFEQAIDEENVRIYDSKDIKIAWNNDPEREGKELAARTITIAISTTLNMKISKGKTTSYFIDMKQLRYLAERHNVPEVDIDKINDKNKDKQC